MTVRTLTPRPATRGLHSPEDLTEALGVPFSPQQLAAITAPLEPGVIIAGAGSGKTTVMAARVVWLVGTGAVRPEQVLGLTFTRKAAAELSQRVRTALLTAGVITDRGVDEAGEQLIMTYDAFAGRLVSEHGLRLGFEADPTLVSGATRFRLASRVVKAASGPFDMISRLRPATVTERVLKLDGDLRQHLVDVAALDKHARDHRMALQSAPLNNRGNVFADVKRALVAGEERLELASLVGDYQELKRHLGVVEFADQMGIAARLASEVPEVSDSLRHTFTVVLLDEYQDTSAAQAIMLRGLFSGATPSEGLGHPVTAVGDPFQAIYGWRGAAASNILQFADDFRSATGQRSRQFPLSVNRRSGQSILDVANNLSRPLRSQAHEVELLRAPDGAGPGQVRAATFTSWSEEVAWVSDQVVAVRADGTAEHWADIAILTRRNADISPLYAELTARDVPVEIVGLGGLLLLPEIRDVTATLRLVDDVTANPELIRLLSGPRWSVGPRDLALLGRRAQELASEHGCRIASDDGDALLVALEQAVSDIDPTEVICLLDALESPGEADYSAEALSRFRRLSAELSALRMHADEPPLDLTRRVVFTMGLDVELMATPEFVRTARRDQLGAFLDAVADYADVDSDASLSGLLAYLQAEIDQGAGLEQAVPSDREAVKLLTVHKAKGLEWQVVFLPALMKGIFPSDRVTDNWVTNPAVLPADLRGDAGSIPQLTEATNAEISRYKQRLTEEQLLAEDRLAYVAATRAKQLLVGTGHWWRAELTKPRIASTYLKAILAEAADQGQVLAEAELPGTDNPLISERAPQEWPKPLDPDALALRQDSAEMVRQARRQFRDIGSYQPSMDHGGEQLLLDSEETVAGWDADISSLLRELEQSRSGHRLVELPSNLTASALLRLRADPGGFAAELARPMPKPPSRAAVFGTRFHQWVERHFAEGLPSGRIGQQQLIDPDDLPDRAGAGTEGPEQLRELCATFLAGQFGDTVPYAVEAPFTLLVGGRLVRGRIDAVYELPTDPSGLAFRYRVVDWKTGAADNADPLQLAIYRLAWAEVCQVPLESVDAVFYYVRRDRLVRPEVLPGRAAIEALMTPGQTRDARPDREAAP